jgi:hypothetical protein
MSVFPRNIGGVLESAFTSHVSNRASIEKHLYHIQLSMFCRSINQSMLFLVPRSSVYIGICLYEEGGDVDMALDCCPIKEQLRLH